MAKSPEGRTPSESKTYRERHTLLTTTVRQAINSDPQQLRQIGSALQREAVKLSFNGINKFSGDGVSLFSVAYGGLHGEASAYLTYKYGETERRVDISKATVELSRKEKTTTLTFVNRTTGDAKCEYIAYDIQIPDEGRISVRTRKNTEIEDEVEQNHYRTLAASAPTRPFPSPRGPEVVLQEVPFVHSESYSGPERRIRVNTDEVHPYTRKGDIDPTTGRIIIGTEPFGNGSVAIYVEGPANVGEQRRDGYTGDETVLLVNRDEVLV